MRKCVPACVCTCVCVGVEFERENIVCGCCIFDELAQHNGPVEGCGGSFQAGITRQVSASTFNAASYHNFSKEKIFVRAAETVLGQQTPPSSCCVTRHTSKSKSEAVSLRMELHEKRFSYSKTFLCPGNIHVQNFLLDTMFLRRHHNQNRVRMFASIELTVIITYDLILR